MNPTALQTALDAAPERPRTAELRDERELFCFRVGTLTFGFGAANVREVLRYSPCTRLPRAPAFLLGVTAHRGEVLPLIDLLRFLARGESKLTERSRYVVATAGAHVAAFVADSIGGIQKIATGDIVEAPIGSDEGASHVGGVVPPNGVLRKEALHLIEVSALLEAIRARVVTR